MYKAYKHNTNPRFLFVCFGRASPLCQIMNTAWPFWAVKDKQGSSRTWLWVPNRHFFFSSLLSTKCICIKLLTERGMACQEACFVCCSHSEIAKRMETIEREFSVMHYQHSGTQILTSTHAKKTPIGFVCWFGTLRRMQTVTQKYLSFPQLIQNGTPFFFSLPFRFCFLVSLS